MDVLIPIPKGIHFHAAAEGVTLKLVRCEACAAEYVYRLERTGRGEGFSPLFLDNEGASKRAQRRAQTNATRKLQTSCDVIPCPECGHIQKHMIRRARRLQFAWLSRLSIALLLGGALLFLITLVAGAGLSRAGRTPSWVFIISLGVLFFGGLGSIVALVTRFWLMFCYDPNTTPVAGRIARGRQVARSRADVERELGHPVDQPPTPGKMVELRQGEWEISFLG